MRVARDHVCEAALDEPHPRRARPRSEAAVERRGGDLDRDTGTDERAQPLRVPLHVGVALGMRQDDTKATQLEAEHEIGEGDRPAEIRELEQQERGIAAEAEPAQRLVAEAGREREVDLPAREHLDADALRLRGLVHLAYEPLHDLGRGRIVVPDVRRRRDVLDSLLVRRPQELEARRERGDAVVDSGQDVRMEVDHRPGS